MNLPLICYYLCTQIDNYGINMLFVFTMTLSHTHNFYTYNLLARFRQN